MRGLKEGGKRQKELLNKTEDEKDEDERETGSGSFEEGNFLESLEKNDSYDLNNEKYII